MSDEPEKKPSLGQVIMSVLAAMFGVQSDKVRRRDFMHGNPWMFIVVGILLAIIFVLILYGVVHWVMAGIGKQG